MMWNRFVSLHCTGIFCRATQKSILRAQDNHIDQLVRNLMITHCFIFSFSLPCSARLCFIYIPAHPSFFFTLNLQPIFLSINISLLSSSNSKWEECVISIVAWMDASSGQHQVCSQLYLLFLLSFFPFCASFNLVVVWLGKMSSFGIMELLL